METGLPWFPPQVALLYSFGDCERTDENKHELDSVEKLMQKDQFAAGYFIEWFLKT